MAKDQTFEIPKELRELAERNVDQARAAQSQLLDVTRQAQAAMLHTGAAAAHGVLELQHAALECAETAVHEGFAHAARLAAAPNLYSALELQRTFAEQQVAASNTRTQDLVTAMMRAARRFQQAPGATKDT